MVNMVKNVLKDLRVKNLNLIFYSVIYLAWGIIKNLNLSNEM